ncbi:MAG: CmcI family methyltransferase [Bryobacteraceae bacterium]
MLDAFHRYYYDNHTQTWGNTRWLGVHTQKLPLDLWIYQEMLFDEKPAVLIECGTFLGGSAYYFASVMDLMNHGRVITIDIEPRDNRPRHPRITYLTGSSISGEIADQVRRLIAPGEKVMVSLDSDHKKDHVLAELRRYGALVSPGGYLVVEDTNINGHPVFPAFGPGPMEAVEQFLKENKKFQPDKTREKFSLTFNPKGYLRRISR